MFCASTPRFEAMYSQEGVAPWQKGKSWLIATGLALDLLLQQELQGFHSQGIADKLITTKC